MRVVKKGSLLPSVTACRHFFHPRPFHPLTQCVHQVVDLRGSVHAAFASLTVKRVSAIEGSDFHLDIFSRNSRIYFFFHSMIYNKVSYCYKFSLSIQNSNLLFWSTIQQFPEEFFRQSGRRRDTRDLKKKERNFESLY